MKIKACYLNSLYCLGMLIPGKAAGEIQLSGGLIFAGHTSHADSCLVLNGGLLEMQFSASTWCHQCLRRLNGAFFFFSKSYC